jgi:NADPH2:quinone reductase
VDIGANIQLEAAVLAAGGIVSAYADPSGPFAAPRPPMLLNAAEVRFVLVYTMPDAAKRAAVTAISAAINERALTPPPATRFSLSDVAAAQDAVELGTVGKVLIDIRLTTPASLTRPQERSNE